MWGDTNVHSYSQPAAQENCVWQLEGGECALCSLPPWIRHCTLGIPYQKWDSKVISIQTHYVIIFQSYTTFKTRNLKHIGFLACCTKYWYHTSMQTAILNYKREEVLCIHTPWPPELSVCNHMIWTLNSHQVIKVSIPSGRFSQRQSRIHSSTWPYL